MLCDIKFVHLTSCPLVSKCPSCSHADEVWMQSQVNYIYTGKELGIQPIVYPKCMLLGRSFLKSSPWTLKLNNNKNANQKLSFSVLLVLAKGVLPEHSVNTLSDSYKCYYEDRICYCHLPWKLLLIREGKVFPNITTVGSMMISLLRPCDPVISRWPPPPSSFSIISLSCRSRRTSCHSPLSRR